ncbi:MAG: putative lipid II flippase FtsW [Actinomycetota bacterium]|nr:putative lipid II flippase FtsW [Actinomycetota bacterium]
MSPIKRNRPATKRATTKRKRRSTPSVEYSMLLTSTLCLLALGVVMVFSASSTTQLLGESGDSAFYLKRTLICVVIGLALMRVLAAKGVTIAQRITPLVLAIAFALSIVVLVPGIGRSANGSQAWLGAGSVQFQPSELMKVMLIVFGASILARRPQMTRGGIGPLMPFLGVVLCGVGVVVVQDFGTAIVMCLAVGALLTAAGARIRDLAVMAGVLAAVAMLAVMLEPYRMERLTSFLNPSADPGGAGFQLIQAKLALGSGGLFGVGLGESLQKAFYLPEAHTDMIGAVIGEELGMVGIAGLLGLYGMFGYAGLRIAKSARNRYTKLLAAGLTSLILIQAMVNLLALLGVAPLTGVPLPFVSYGNSSMLVMLGAVGILLNIAANPGAKLRVVDGGRAKINERRNSRNKRVPPAASSSTGASGNRRGRNRRARGTGAGGRRRATG